MQRKFFMQLIVLLAALALFGGGSRNTVRPDEMLEILKYAVKDSDLEKIVGEAEKISGLLNAALPYVTAPQAGDFSSAAAPPAATGSDVEVALKPISEVADPGIYAALSAAL